MKPGKRHLVNKKVLQCKVVFRDERALKAKCDFCGEHVRQGKGEDLLIRLCFEVRCDGGVQYVCSTDLKMQIA